MKVMDLIASFALLASVASFSRAESCAGNGTPPCANKTICKLNAQNKIYCQGCDRTKYTGYRCEVPLKGQSCVHNGTSDGKLDPCMNNSKCSLNSKGLIFCSGCDRTKYSGFRCEQPVTPPPPKQSCDQNGSGDGVTPCEHGTKCNLNDKGLIYCTGCNAQFYTGNRCQTPAPGCPIPCGRTTGVIFYPPNIDYHTGFNDGITMDTTCCTGGTKCFTDKNIATDKFSTACKAPKSCPNGQTPCGSTTIEDAIFDNTQCCDDATQICQGSFGEGGSGTACSPKPT